MTLTLIKYVEKSSFHGRKFPFTVKNELKIGTLVTILPGARRYTSVLELVGPVSYTADGRDSQLI